MNSKLPEISDIVLYEGEQYTVINCDHENLIYEIDNDNYVGFALLSELTLLENVSKDTESSELQSEKTESYSEFKIDNPLLS